MSLLLTSSIKPILEDLNLPDCSLSIKVGNLVLTGPCGQQLFTIPGFNQTTLRKAEIPLAINLVTTFLNKNIELIRSFFSLRQVRKSQLDHLPALKVKLQADRYTLSQIGYGQSPDYNVVKTEDFGQVTMTTKDSRIAYITLNKEIDLKKTLKLIPALEKQMQQDLLFFTEMNKVNLALEEATKTLASCTTY